MKKHIALLLSFVLVLMALACAEPAKPQSETPAEPEKTAVEESAETAKVAAEEVRGITIPPFSVKVNGVAVTNETMAAYPAYSVQSFSVNSSGTETTCRYIGFAITDVLSAVGIADGYTKVEAIADDGYTIEFTAEQAAAPTTLLAVTKDGEQFKKNPWFAPCASETSGDYLKGFVELRVDAEVTVTPEAVEEIPEETEGTELPEIQDKTDKVRFEAFSFLLNGETVDNAKLEGLHIYKITVKTVNSKGAESENTYTGYRLSDVLEACGVNEYTAVVAVANDGYESEFDAEAANSEYCLVAIEKDKELGEDGTIWLAPCDKTESKAYAKLVVELRTK